MIFGYNKNNQPIEVRYQIFNEHLLMAGSSGSGKTNTFIFWILQFALLVKGMLIFDFQKRDFSGIKQALQDNGSNLIILSKDNLKLNILQPPKGVGANLWAVHVSELLCQALNLPSRASKLLQVHILKLYEKFGGQAKMESQKRYPTLFDLKDSIRSDIKANYQAARAVLDTLEPILLAHPNLFSWCYGWTVDELTKHHITFELRGLLEPVKNLILGYTASSEFIRRNETGASNRKLDTIFICDESQRLISAAGGANCSVIKDQISQIRGTGLGLLLGIQSVNQIVPEVLSSTATKVIGRCGSATDYDFMGRSMGLTRKQIEWPKRHLHPGLFIGQVSSSKWREPFLFSVPNMEHVKSAPQSPDSDPLAHLVAVSTFQKTVEITSKSEAIVLESPQEYSLLKAIIENPLQPSSSYIKPAGISSKTAVKVRKSLLAKKMIREHSLGTGANGRGKILLEVLPEANDAIKLYESAGE